jgi:hypothetical protein
VWFGDVAIGQAFTFQGKRFVKEAAAAMRTPSRNSPIRYEREI